MTNIVSCVYIIRVLFINESFKFVLAATLWWFTAALKHLKIKVVGSPSPQGSQKPYILGDTTRPGHVTCVLVWSKSDRRRLIKTLHKQTNRQTDRQTDTTKIMVTWPWTKSAKSTKQDSRSKTVATPQRTASHYHIYITDSISTSQFMEWNLSLRTHSKHPLRIPSTAKVVRRRFNFW